MFGNPHRYKVSLQRFETRHANAGCLLAVLFAIPFLARSYNMVILSCAALIYVLLVVPIATGFYHVGLLLSLGKRVLIRNIMNESSLLRTSIKHTIEFFKWLHHVYVHVESMHITTNQILFNLTAEKVMCPDQRFSCLYVLLFYTVLAYLQQSLQKRQWSQVLHETSAADFIRLTTAFVVARLGKAIVMGLVLLTFTVQFNDIEPTFTYVLITMIYFLFTQYAGEAGDETKLVQFIRKLDMYELEGLEEWWVPMLMRIVSASMSMVLAVFAFAYNYWFLSVLTIYTNVYVSTEQMIENCWIPLKAHRLETSTFPLVTFRQLKERGDQMCPVCLDEMRPLSARITPCKHVFHAFCLRKCIQQYAQCPLCKHPL